MKMEKDKWLHIGACAAVSWCVSLLLCVSASTYSLISGKAIDNDIVAMFVFGGFLSGVSIGLGKEYGDKCNPDDYWDWEDVIADIIGSFIGSFVAFISLIMVFK